MSSGIEDRLKALDGAVLAALLLKRAGFDEDFRLWLEAELAALESRETRTRLDPEPFRRRAEVLLEAAGGGRCRRHWDDGRSSIDEAELEELIGQAEPFLASGDSANALAILKPVAGALAEYWPECANWDETLHEFFPMLDRMIAQAVLMDDYSREAREDLADEPSGWQEGVSEYGADGAFAVAIAVSALGWDEPGLEDVLVGRKGIWPPAGKSGWRNDELTAARLAALEAMGRTDHFLNLSKAAGRDDDHAVMLAKHERIDEALKIAHAKLLDPAGVLRLAETLLEKDRRDAAFDLGAWGLSLPAEESGSGGMHHRLALARWLRDRAQTAGRQDLAILAARAAFEESLSREDFRVAENLSEATDWSDMRAALLKRLMDSKYAHDRLDILLDENLIDDAVAVVEREHDGHLSPYDGTLMRLVDAACPRQPDWTIRFAFRMATPIMEEGRSGHYDLAARWLEQAGHAYAAAGKRDEWYYCLDALIETHRRKHKLRPLLEALRKTGEE